MEELGKLQWLRGHGLWQKTGSRGGGAQASAIGAEQGIYTCV